jgi:hypothetical protein
MAENCCSEEILSSVSWDISEISQNSVRKLAHGTHSCRDEQLQACSHMPRSGAVRHVIIYETFYCRHVFFIVEAFFLYYYTCVFFTVLLGFELLLVKNVAFSRLVPDLLWVILSVHQTAR